MVWSVTYANPSELCLDYQSLSAALALNECLPKKNGILWVTFEELKNRLIHGGVDPALEKTDVSDALLKCNRGIENGKVTLTSDSVFMMRVQQKTSASNLKQLCHKRTSSRKTNVPNQY